MRHMHLFSRPSSWIRKLRKSLYLRFAYDRAAIDAEEDRKLAGFGDIQAATRKLDSVLAACGRGPYDPDRDSVHLLLWSLLSLRHPARRILEIGTFEGEGTRLLARLFPSADITTVELPDDDPLFRTFYRRSTEAEREAFRIKQSRNLDFPNIRLLKANSFFLPALAHGPFDLIWVDGGHLYPEVAWDICNAWHLAAPGGVILFDDVLPDAEARKTDLISPESFEALEYLRARVPGLAIPMFLKRRFPFRGDTLKRTCVAALIKPLDA